MSVSLLIGRSRALTSDLGKKYRHILIHDDDADDASLIALAKGLHTADSLDFVTSFVDRTQVLANRIAAELDLPVVIESKLVELTRDKWATRRLLEQHALCYCRFSVASTKDELARAIDSVGLPCIVKPVAGEGSRNVRKLRSVEDVATFIAALEGPALDGKLLVEQFLEGDEYSVEAISIAGEHHVVAITRKYKDDHNFVEYGHVVPAPLGENSREAIEQYVRKVLTALGFYNSPSHSEVIVTAEGPRLVETHTRIGGDRIGDLVQQVTGVDLYDLYARQMAHLPMENLVSQTPQAKAAAVWYLLERSLEQQIVAEVRGVDEAERCPDVRQVGVLKKPGARGGEINASADRSAFVIAVGDDAEHAVAAARNAAAKIRLFYRFDSGDTD
ncbi:MULTISPECIES: ATP-grasp domain-containing protein [Paraburkholderia]|uniref:ATP-grasp domain-containing protein n=1 Tax=Paraburkholderia TaxID=1822464 RepID=UPI002253EAB0|nr:MULTISPECIES: ATP-grasp domain-containing protein [Paraburkholderia]MCX4165042.1 ATP-grasp domain-containing protein [Paraburkholderia megapolitana]MDN7160535.1 ATP-grasp domain-containing protein [Paraburkholderia sp. CHISQ3]MDQ6497582.1 ATP-grasp domain-containing protein [Paraburkholderia megapolitana]